MDAPSLPPITEVPKVILQGCKTDSVTEQDHKDGECKRRCDDHALLLADQRGLDACHCGVSLWRVTVACHSGMLAAIAPVLLSGADLSLLTKVGHFNVLLSGRWSDLTGERLVVGPVRACDSGESDECLRRDPRVRNRNTVVG